MTEQQKQWIKDNVTSTGYGKCSKITEAMQKAFPELVRVRGHYHCPFWGSREHWWLKNADGKIIDPTARQFPNGGCSLWYEEWVEGAKEPMGKCANCGGYVYSDSFFCSQKCYAECCATLKR